LKKIKTDAVPVSALEQIWRRFSERLGRFIRSRLGDSAAAEDILQDVFVKLQKRLGEFQDPAKIEGWLFLVARNAVIDHYRTQKPTSEVPEWLPVELPATEAIEIEELHTRLAQIIQRLPKKYREAFMLTAFEGLSQEQLAKHLGISVSGAKSRVQRARERVKELVIEFCRREFGQTPGCQPCPRGLFPIGAMARPKPNHDSKKSKRANHSKGDSHV
jgi:RNA polymerase sigma-70 factor (ECF subfamily)